MPEHLTLGSKLVCAVLGVASGDMRIMRSVRKCQSGDLSAVVKSKE